MLVFLGQDLNSFFMDLSGVETAAHLYSQYAILIFPENHLRR